MLGGGEGERERGRERERKGRREEEGGEEGQRDASTTLLVSTGLWS